VPSGESSNSESRYNVSRFVRLVNTEVYIISSRGALNLSSGILAARRREFALDEERFAPSAGARYARGEVVV